MKIKMTLLIICTALITLSFTYIATQQHAKPVAKETKSCQQTPVGGLVSEIN